MNQGANLTSPNGARTDAELQGRFLELANHIQSRCTRARNSWPSTAPRTRTSRASTRRRSARRAGSCSGRCRSNSYAAIGTQSAGSPWAVSRPRSSAVRCRDRGVARALPTSRRIPTALTPGSPPHGGPRSDETPDGGNGAGAGPRRRGRTRVRRHLGFGRNLLRFRQLVWSAKLVLQPYNSTSTGASTTARQGGEMQLRGLCLDEAEYRRRLASALEQLEISRGSRRRFSPASTASTWPPMPSPKSSAC